MKEKSIINKINENFQKTKKDSKLLRKQRLKRIKEIREYYKSQRYVYYKDNHVKILRKKVNYDRY